MHRRSGLPLAGSLALAYGLTALAGAWAAYDRPAAWARFGLIALGLGLMFLLAWAGARWGERFLGPAALGCAALAAGLALYTLLAARWDASAGAKLPALQQAGAWVQAHRPAVALPEDIHPNVAGGLLAILLPLGAGGCGWAWQRGQRGVALAGGLAVLLGGVVVILTASRGAWLGLAAAALVALAARPIFQPGILSGVVTAFGPPYRMKMHKRSTPSLRSGQALSGAPQCAVEGGGAASGRGRILRLHSTALRPERNRVESKDGRLRSAQDASKVIFRAAGAGAPAQSKDRGRLLRTLLVAAAVAALALPVLLARVNLPLADRLAGSVGVGGTAVSRVALWRDALALIGDYPFTGSGLGMTAMIYSTYGLLIHAPYLDHMHSLLLQVAVEQGVLGAALFAALAAGALWTALAGRGAGQPQAGQPQGCGQPQGLPLRVAAAAGVMALAVHGAVDAGVFVSKAAPLLFLPLGMAYGGRMKDEGGSLKDEGGRMKDEGGSLGDEGGRMKDEGGVFHPSSFILHPLVVLALAAAAALLLLPGSQAAFQANLGSLSQTRAELAAFHWPDTPLQDVLRRPGGVDLAPSIAWFQAALALDPANVTANRRLGQIALANEDFAAARRYLEAAYRAAPGQRATRQMLGELAALEGDPAAAAELWRGLAFAGGQLEVREWWYGYRGQPQYADAIRQAGR